MEWRINNTKFHSFSAFGAFVCYFFIDSAVEAGSVGNRDHSKREISMKILFRSYEILWSDHTARHEILLRYDADVHAAGMQFQANKPKRVPSLGKQRVFPSYATVEMATVRNHFNLRSLLTINGNLYFLKIQNFHVVLSQINSSGYLL